MATEQWKIGDVTVTKIEEVAFWAPMQFLHNTLATSTRGELEAMKWLHPTWMNRNGDMVDGSVNSFLIETPTKKLLVDTGVGNGRARKNETFDGL